MTHFVTTFITHHGYLAIFLLMVLESACVPIPSEAVMLFGGALAGGLVIGQSHANVNVLGIAALGTLGNLVGSLISYGVGRYGGRSLIESGSVSWLVRPHHLAKSDAFFARRGAAAVFVGRLLPVIRTFISLPAGVAEMPALKFTAYTVLGCLPWTFALALGGDALTTHWRSLDKALGPVSIVIAVVVVAALAVLWRRSRNEEVQV